jgi:hypothetical protein
VQEQAQAGQQRADAAGRQQIEDLSGRPVEPGEPDQQPDSEQKQPASDDVANRALLGAEL